MKWRCALIQPRLPDYPDGELSPFWKRLVTAHVKDCPECRQELEELSEVVRLYKAHPLPDPGPSFWQKFDRELHLKLAQVNQSPEPALRYRRLPHYLVGATALAGILALAVYLGPFTTSTPEPAMVRRQEESKIQAKSLVTKAPQAPKATAVVPEPPSSGETRPAELSFSDKSKALPRFVPPGHSPGKGVNYSIVASKLEETPRTALGEEGFWPDDDFLSWDVDTVVADLSREEREDLKKRLESRR